MAIVIIPAPEYEAQELPPTATEAQRHQVEVAADALLVGFTWQDSAEGSNFWHAVQRRLAQISEDGVLR